MKSFLAFNSATYYYRRMVIPTMDGGRDAVAGFLTQPANCGG